MYVQLEIPVQAAVSLLVQTYVIMLCLLYPWLMRVFMLGYRFFAYRILKRMSFVRRNPTVS
jgi:hypothetical protein